MERVQKRVLRERNGEREAERDILMAVLPPQRCSELLPTGVNMTFISVLLLLILSTFIFTLYFTFFT